MYFHTVIVGAGVARLPVFNIEHAFYIAQERVYVRTIYTLCICILAGKRGSICVCKHVFCIYGNMYSMQACILYIINIEHASMYTRAIYLYRACKYVTHVSMYAHTCIHTGRVGAGVARVPGDSA